ncbi:hypothetical protein TNCV_1684621 [Trichonephila clavipes]|nr:hypothetical protein TNCV_1684621 [Trichonephila clavipes]
MIRICIKIATGHFGTGGSKFITRKSSLVQLIWTLPGLLSIDKPALKIEYMTFCGPTGLRFSRSFAQVFPHLKGSCIIPFVMDQPHLFDSRTASSVTQDRTITIKNLYHPPNKQHLDTIMIEGLFDDNTIILGNFNAKNTTWSSTIPNARSLELSNLVNDKAFLPLNDVTPTFRSNSYGSTVVLNLTFKNPCLFPYSYWTVLDIISNDNLPILIEIDLKCGVRPMGWRDNPARGARAYRK